MKISKETDLLEPGFRKKIIEEIDGPENVRRRNEMYKRYEALKDRTDIWVEQLLLEQFDSITVNEMQYALTNISLTRKIVDKLSRVYCNSVKRNLEKKKDLKVVEDIARHLDLNNKLSKADKYLTTFKNTMIHPKPYKVTTNDDNEKWDLKVQVLAPFLYDVIPDPNNDEKPYVIILSDFNPRRTILSSLAGDCREKFGRTDLNRRPGDNKNQVIADEPNDTEREKRKFIWWSPNFHFVTDNDGAIISGADLENPIKKLPFVNCAEDQDGDFWALGGQDITDGGIKINALLTHINHISITQGYGQLVMKGLNLPKAVKVGPNTAIQLEYDPNNNEPSPDAQFISANPPVSELLQLVETYVALLLSTNNLSTSGFATDLASGQSFASGVALMIDKAESVQDVRERQQVFIDKEPKIWDIIKSWHESFKEKELLVEKLQEMPVLERTDVRVKFEEPQPIESEENKLANIEKRRALGLNTEVELLMRDDPSLDEKQALKKLEDLIAEKQMKIQRAVNRMTGQDQPEESLDADQSNEV